MVAEVNGTLRCLAPGQGLSVKAPGHLEQKVSGVFSGLPARHPALPLVSSTWISCRLSSPPRLRGDCQEVVAGVTHSVRVSHSVNVLTGFLFPSFPALCGRLVRSNLAGAPRRQRLSVASRRSLG